MAKNWRLAVGHQTKGAFVCLAMALTAFSLQPKSSQPEIKNPQPVEVSILELVDHPDSYNNMRVRVRGIIGTDFESFTLDYKNPKTHKFASIWIDYKDDSSVAKEYRGKYHMDDFFKDVRSGRFTKGDLDLPWLIPLKVSPVPPEQTRAIDKALKRNHGRPVYVIIDGRFDYTPGGRLICSPDGEFSWSGGFGNRNGYGYRIVVENIKKTKKG